MSEGARDAAADRRIRFGKALKAFRLNGEWTQARFALEIGKDQAMVSGYESGKVEPSIDTVVAIEDVLNLSPGTLSRYLGWLPVDAGDTVDPPDIDIVKGVIQAESVRAIEAFCADAGVQRTTAPRQSLNDRVAELEKLIETLSGGGGGLVLPTNLDERRIKLV